MKTIALILTLILILCGCSNQPTIKTEYKDKYIPIAIVPYPPEVTEPDYYINNLTEEQKNDIGELAKAYIITLREANNYIKNLKMVYDHYMELAKNSEDRLNTLKRMGADVNRLELENSLNEDRSKLSNRINETNKKYSEGLMQSMSKMDESP